MQRGVPIKTKVAVCWMGPMAGLTWPVAGLTAPPSGVAEGLLWALFDTFSSWQESSTRLYSTVQNVAEVRKNIFMTIFKLLAWKNKLKISNSKKSQCINNLNACEEHIRTDRKITATVTIEEVIGLTGKAARVTPAVCARYWTGLAHAPAPVLVGALRAMPATLVSETAEKNFSSKSLSCCMSRPIHFYGLVSLHVSHEVRRKLHFCMTFAYMDKPKKKKAKLNHMHKATSMCTL